ncbi:hypothetical protein ZOD2009_13821 [Haladaptatus paucihalophilus DX253]|uniref:Uncharacterized protein n=1 Tax=Haladaptatus paucihalophilus DX253 TaxID=797209 RepID=E7QVC8_HALPU|nr:hypothetical protein ZOD2009_13821 [Haladaptatus paucihalophilus DX253]
MELFFVGESKNKREARNSKKSTVGYIVEFSMSMTLEWRFFGMSNIMP